MNFVLKSIEKLKKSIFGVWQFAGLGRRADQVVTPAPKPGSAEALPEGTVQLVLSGRDIPARSQARVNIDYREAGEEPGFLDQFPPHPLMLKPEPIDDLKSPAINKTRRKKP